MEPLLPLITFLCLCVLLVFLLEPQVSQDVVPQWRIAVLKVRSSSLDINSFPNTTGPGIPQRIRSVLNAKYGGVDEAAETFFGAATAVSKLEAECGWDASVSAFRNTSCMEQFGYRVSPPVEDDHSCEDIDIVVPSIRDLDFLEAWKPFFLGCHIIVIQDGDPSRQLQVPDWAAFELYNRVDIEKALGDRAWIISSRDASVRNFGFLVSRKRYVYTIDDDCLPATRPDGTLVDAIAGHLRNLRSPATPYFFNTLYDPYHPVADFVRGYPYSLRQGVSTALSHGIWVNVPDYDAPTQLLKPAERNTRLLDFTLTIPAGVLYPMCSMNVAFDRERIGPAFMQGLMGDGQPWARYDDMFAGWASKVIADHLHLGVKSGAPYIKHNKASNPFTNLRKEYKGLAWQEQLIDFFDNLTFAWCDSPQSCYLELAARIRREFSQLHRYFTRLAAAMELWVKTWDEVQNRTLTLMPSRQSRRRDLAVLTCLREDHPAIELWLTHYRLSFDLQDIWLLDAANTITPAVRAMPNVLPVTSAVDPDNMCHHAIRNTLHRLFGMGYQLVLLTEVNELLFAPGSLRSHLCPYTDPSSPSLAASSSTRGPWDQAVVLQRKALPHSTKHVLFRQHAMISSNQTSSRPLTEAGAISLMLVRLHGMDYKAAHEQWLRSSNTTHHRGGAAVDPDKYHAWLKKMLAGHHNVPAWLVAQEPRPSILPCAALQSRRLSNATTAL